MSVREKSFEQWGEPTIYENLTHFEKSFTLEDQVISIVGGALPLDMLFKHGESDTLFVFFNSAIGHGEVTLPIFTWLSVSKNLNSSRLFISDPSLVLSQDLTLSWYVGTRNFPAQAAIKDALSVVLNACGKRVVFVGSSGGAYPAIYYANVFDNAAAVVNAPATSLRAHHSEKALRKYAQTCFGVDYQPDFFDVQAPWIAADLPDFIGGRLKNPIVIMQNRDDEIYITKHVVPLLKSIGQEWTGSSFTTNNVTVIVEEWGVGHCSPPRNVLHEVLMGMCEHDGTDFSKLKISRPFAVETVQTRFEDGVHIAECRASEDGCEFAFYLMRGTEKLDIQWYGKKNRYVIGSDHAPGDYKVLAFARRKADKTVKNKFSRPFQIQ